MKKIEYQQIEYSHYPSSKELNEEGINGWELIQIFPTEIECFHPTLECYFTKEVYRATFKKIYEK